MLSNTFSISSSLWTSKVPVEEPANSFTPQHLTMYAPDCYDKLGTYAQMNPPIREKSHYDRLWYAVRNNYNDTIGSDHAPHL